MTDPAQQANNDLDGILTNGWPRCWAWVDGRRDYTLGHNQDHQGHNAPESIPDGWPNPNGVKDRGPYIHTNPKGEKHAGTPSHLDHGVIAAEAVGFRYVASNNVRYDVPDILIILLESLIQALGAEGMEKLHRVASERRNLPWDKTGR